VTVTLYVLDCDCCCALLDEVPQPARASRKQNNIHRPFGDLPANPNQNRGSGEARTKTNPEGVGINRPLLVALTVIFVLWGVPPDSVAGAKLQPQPLGRPEQANVSEAINPFCGATETVNEPDVPCDIARALLESVSP
jgi:hypothetical protein